MRELNIKQKKLIEQWAKENNQIYSYNNLSVEQWDKLVNINDNEMLAINTNRYIMDIKMRDWIGYTNKSKPSKNIIKERI